MKKTLSLPGCAIWCTVLFSCKKDLKTGTVPSSDDHDPWNLISRSASTKTK